MNRVYSIASIALVIALTAPRLEAAVDPEALRLRNLGLAELENEQPARAEEHFRALVSLVPEDPLAYANLAVAALRQQDFEAALSWIDKALDKSPKQPELLAIRGEVLQWSGRPEQALPVFRAAAAAAPQDVEIQYALLRQASTLTSEEAESAGSAALERLRELRPENLVVLMQAGQQRLAAGDRAAASGIYLRVREVLWQAPPAAMTLVDQILQGLETGDLEATRVPALRLENVVKVTPMFREGLRELSPGIQGVPITRFRDEPTPRAFGDPVSVRFVAAAAAEHGTLVGGLATGDFDDDQKADWLRLTDEGGGTIEIWLAAAPDAPHGRLPSPGLTRLLAADLDNDGHLDLIAAGKEAMRFWRGLGSGRFEEATAAMGLDEVGAVAATVLDFDIEGDLDLVAAGGVGGPLQLFLNSLGGALQPVGERTFPELALHGVRDLIASDLDRDGDVDLLIAQDTGLMWLDNLRQGQFADRTREGGLGGASDVRTMVSADLDNDGLPDLVTVGRGVRFLHNQGGRFVAWEIGERLQSTAEFTAILAFDANNDGRLDLALAGPAGLAAAIQDGEGGFRLVNLEKPPASANALLALDLDQDCDLDLIVGSGEGVWRLENEGGDQNHCLNVRLQGLDKGNSKNNRFGVGSTLEIRSGEAYQFREVVSDSTHLGLGARPEADLLRVVWTNGVPQNRLQPAASQRIVEEQVLKGSCPFVYARQADGIRFVTDLLWGAPIGLPVAPGVWASTDPQELVKLPGITALEGHYDLRITEELWEAAYFDHVRLWVVDHPAELEVASSLRIVPGARINDQVLATRNLRPLAAAWDSSGAEAAQRLGARDEVYVSPWQQSPYQGVAAEPWSLTLDLGAAPAAPIRLHLDGWIFPTDASLNLALAQQSTYASWPAPRLDVQTDQGWQVLMPVMGFPAGKTKTMVVDTPPLPTEARKLRITGTQWLSFDRIVWSTERADAEPIIRARLSPTVAELRYRGFSRMYRSAPNGPHYFDYSTVRLDSPWLPLAGRYTRYGDVRELLAAADDRSVIMAPGDEMTLVFEARDLPALAPGWQRTVFLESHGWDKDADRNTGAGQQVEPLPFRAMSTYPYGSEESFPDSDLHRDYLQNWLTREVEATTGTPPLSSP